MNTYTDAAYNVSLAGLPYMMPVSPWFYTNLPGYGKNWLWAGDELWFDRWQEVWSFQPEWVEIISWNDFGESHYIGPLVNYPHHRMLAKRAKFGLTHGQDSRQFTPFNADLGNAPYNVRKTDIFHLHDPICTH